MGYATLVLWPKNELKYQGLCSHSALLEGCGVDLGLTAEQLIAKAAEMKQRVKENDARKHEKAMQTKPEVIRAQKRQAYRRQRARPGMREKQNAMIRTSRALARPTETEETRLERNRKQAERDRQRAAMNEDRFVCAECGLKFNRQANPKLHVTDIHEEALVYCDNVGCDKSYKR